MSLLPLQPHRYRLDPVDRWIESLSTRLDGGAVGACVVHLELFCQARGTAPGDLLLGWRRFAAELDDVVADFLRHNGIEVPLSAAG